jgi:cytochrome c oxidase subunit 4
MSEFHDDFPQYELMAHHSEQAGKGIRKKLWRVFWIMLGITLMELLVGYNAESWGLLDNHRATTFGLKVFFVFFTIAKAAFIVLSFMHLGNERKELKWVIIGPYCTFIVYLAFMVSVGEGGYSQSRRAEMDPNVVKQAADHKRPGWGSHNESASESEGESIHGQR